MYILYFFFLNDTATTEIYTLPLHDALPILDLSAASGSVSADDIGSDVQVSSASGNVTVSNVKGDRSEEHTSELQSQSNLVCRLLLEKKKASRCGRLASSSRRPSRQTKILFS